MKISPTFDFLNMEAALAIFIRMASFVETQVLGELILFYWRLTEGREGKVEDFAVSQNKLKF